MKGGRIRGYLLATSVGSAVAVVAATLPAYASPGKTAGSIRFSLRLSSHRLRYGSEVVLSIRMQTGTHGQTAGVGLSASNWPQRDVYGSAVAFGGQRISGAGSITGGFGTSPGGYAAGPMCVRGPLQTGDGGPVVSLPPHSVTVLSYKVRLADPPWPGMRPTVGAWAYVPAMGRGARAYNLGAIRARAVGQTGVRISLSVTHGAGHPHGGWGPVARKGKSVLIDGGTDPALAGARVVLSAATYGRHQTRVAIGSTRTSGDAFQISWRAPRRGRYMVIARVSHPGGHHLPDRGCDLKLTVR